MTQRRRTRAFRKKIGLPGAQLLLTVGNVTERKGQQVVIRALPHVLKAQPNTHYLMAGLPTRREDFLKLARGLGVADTSTSSAGCRPRT